ncbi:MAG: hypothetical protein ABW170_15560 [Candidatus Thiodiazotropha sp. L084R]
MKWISSSMAILVFCFSQQGFCQTPPANQPSVDDLRTKLLSILNNGLSIMDKSKSCFSGVKDESAFNHCTSLMPEKFKQDVLNQLNPSQNVLNLKPESAQKLTYTNETNLRIIEYIDAGINSSHKMLQCITLGKSADQFQGCINGSPNHSTNQVPTRTGSNHQLSEDW